MIFNEDPGLAPGMSANLIAWSGDPADLLFAGDGSDWAAAILATGTFIPRKSVLVDLVLVAGGQTGLLGENGLGGVGGAGGEVLLQSSVLLRMGVTYSATIGGADQDTLLEGGGLHLTARTAQGSPGGNPSSSRGTPPTKGSPGTQVWGGENPIESLAGVKFGAGGGPGGYCSSNYAYYTGADGGDTGGGRGGYPTDTEASPGADHTGSGGGGAWRSDAGGGHGTPGPGGSGILMFRPHKEV